MQNYIKERSPEINRPPTICYKGCATRQTILRRLYTMQEIGSHPNHFIRLNLPARANIMWWYLFVKEWNGVSLLWDLSLWKPNLEVYTDAFGMWRCGTFLDPMWFHLEWSGRLRPLSIVVKEMFPVVLAAAKFGDQ